MHSMPPRALRCGIEESLSERTKSDSSLSSEQWLLHREWVAGEGRQDRAFPNLSARQSQLSH